MATVEEALLIAVELHQGGSLDQAETLYRRILDALPDQADALHLLGVLRAQRGDGASAVALLRRAIAARPEAGDYHGNLGKAHLLAGDTLPALTAFGRAARLAPDVGEHAANHAQALERFGPGARLALDPADAPQWNERGIGWHRAGRLDAAEAAFRRALILEPECVAAANNLAGTLLPAGPPEAALWWFRRALVLMPDHSDAATNLGNVLNRVGRIGDGFAWCDRAVRLRPDDANAAANLARLLQAQTRIAEAVAQFRRAVDINPGHPSMHSDLIFCMDLDSGRSVAEQQAERRRWAARHADPLTPAAPVFANPRDPERRLRVGYVSADFRSHSAAFVFAPVLTGHDPARVEVVCYSNHDACDAMTERLRGAASLWRTVTRLSDEALAAQVRADGIDVLVDLSGHSAGNRLRAFARRPAPVQVSAWGHVTGTGMAAMDALFADAVVVAAEDRGLFAETVVDLPCMLCCEPPVNAPAAAPLPPAMGDGVVTFGSLNKLSKVSDEALALWCRILRAVPESRLLIKFAGLEEPSVRARLTGFAAARGVAADRLLLLGRTGRAEHMATYGRVDIALDPFPQNGGVTTMEALWMGVPVLALLGRTLPGRIGAAILTATGCPDWIAGSEEDYLHLAVERAADVEELRRLRGVLRARVATSPVGDTAAYTRAVEDAYRRLWRDWCGQTA
ncbi:MAG TPA: tetratricopeptide repeat protein [Azospirillum sp.]